MSESGKIKNYHEDFKNKVISKEEKRMNARQAGCEPVNWLGMLGMIGWSVTLPLAAGIALGVWIDKQVHSRYSFTIMLMFAGLAGGCALAWYWIRRSAGNFGNKGKNCK